MNKIGEIIANKQRKTITEETIYETYKRTLCAECENKHNDKDLCKITVTRDQKARCFNYESCMKNKCKTCKRNQKCNI
ncbi:MAG TPA: hypothetical protein DCE23_04125 [Firmicutes bacterium]|nr:hypothetical protein [Bacillota bacterium]